MCDIIDSKTPPFGWAILGCGNIAQIVAKEIVKSGCGRIAAVWNRTRSRAEQFARRFGGKVCASPSETICAEGVEGVYIALTHNLHAEYARLALEHGVPVLCEKPIAVSEGEAQALFAFARNKGVYLSEGMWTWHNPIAIRVREWVKSGRIGSVRAVKAKYAFPIVQLSRNPRLTDPKLAGGALLDIGIYPLRYLLELFGMPKGVTCTGQCRGGVDLGERITLDFGTFQAELEISITRFGGEKLEIEGSEGKITVPYFHAARKASLRGSQRERCKDGELLYARQMRQVAEEIRAGMLESGYNPPEMTLAALKLIDECRARLGLKPSV